MSEPRCYLYSSDCPQGKIFQGEDAIAKALKDGWKDTPTKLKGGKGKAANDKGKPAS